MLTGFGAREVAPGLWRWPAYHPEWLDEVASHALVTSDEVVLVDPLLPSGARLGYAWQALDRAAERGTGIAIVLTVFWHERSADAILLRYPTSTSWAAESAVERLSCHVTHPFRAGDALPGGLIAHATARPGEVVLWEPGSKALIAGDVLLGEGRDGLVLCPESWLPSGVSREELARSLAPILALPIELVLVGHGQPVLENARHHLRTALESPSLPERGASSS